MRRSRPESNATRRPDPAESEATLVHMDAVEVRRSSRARQWRLEVPWGKPARLTVPRWTSRSEIERLLAEKRPWIEKQQRRHLPRLGLEELAVSESEARISAREHLKSSGESRARGRLCLLRAPGAVAL